MKHGFLLKMLLCVSIFHLSPFTFHLSLAQQGTIKGRVVDARSGENIEYATVALLSVKDSAIKGGTVTEANGTFTIKAPYGRSPARSRPSPSSVSSRTSPN